MIQVVLILSTLIICQSRLYETNTLSTLWIQRGGSDRSSYHIITISFLELNRWVVERFSACTELQRNTRFFLSIRPVAALSTRALRSSYVVKYNDKKLKTPRVGRGLGRGGAGRVTGAAPEDPGPGPGFRLQLLFGRPDQGCWNLNRIS